MVICQKNRFIVNGIWIRMKLYQHEDPFRLLAESAGYYKVEIRYASLRVCQVKFIYLVFYVAFNTIQVISRRVVGRAEETSTYSSLGFCTVNC